MSAEINCLYPKGLKHAAAEHGKPRHDPPLRFAPRKQLTKSEDGLMTPKTITVDLDGDTTTKIVPHLFFDIENFLKMQVNHRYILSQQGAIVKWDNLKLIHEQKKRDQGCCIAFLKQGPEETRVSQGTQRNCPG